MSEHILHIEYIEDEGFTKFRIECSAKDGEKCPYLRNDEDYTGCLADDELGNIGGEIIRGKAEGQGPWPVKLTYEGYGEDAEGWIDLL